ncbi:hypothetical protein PGTUg99_022455 [Puccinia graminis f. sp. tritici]|uniref:Uncharacterized protein n=1 Tax=Puccinia graminis f. sp. tritici TaxID=56615 RepID=A0A5B0SHQ0_PUCGR|nr:hypothetical protein PGTUg99_022455 [Puccinia graminis f. sp. tritici]
MASSIPVNLAATGKPTLRPVMPKDQSSQTSPTASLLASQPTAAMVKNITNPKLLKEQTPKQSQVHPLPIVVDLTHVDVAVPRHMAIDLTDVPDHPIRKDATTHHQNNVAADSCSNQEPTQDASINLVPRPGPAGPWACYLLPNLGEEVTR